MTTRVISRLQVCYASQLRGGYPSLELSMRPATQPEHLGLHKLAITMTTPQCPVTVEIAWMILIWNCNAFSTVILIRPEEMTCCLCDTMHTQVAYVFTYCMEQEGGTVVVDKPIDLEFVRFLRSV